MTQPQREREDVIRARQEQLRPSMVDDKWGQFSGLEHKLFNAIDTLLAALAEAQERVEKAEAEESKCYGKLKHLMGALVDAGASVSQPHDVVHHANEIRKLGQRAEQAERELAEALARIEEKNEQLADVARKRSELENVCLRCHGAGFRLYGSTATWRGGIGGAAMTVDVCDTCWGSGDDKKPWLSHKEASDLRTEAGRLRAALTEIHAAVGTARAILCSDREWDGVEQLLRADKLAVEALTPRAQGGEQP